MSVNQLCANGMSNLRITKTGITSRNICVSPTRLTSALTVQEALDQDDVLNLVNTGILNAFQTIQDEITSVQDTSHPLMDPMPESSTMNSTTPTVSDLTLQTMQQQMQLMQQMIDQTNVSMGHLDQVHKNVQSTKLSHPEPKRFTTMTKIIPFSAKEMSYKDMVGAFPYTSS